MARWLAGALIALLLGQGPLHAADIVVDLETGGVLLEHEADAVRRPASLVKLMTAFLAFEALEAGAIAESDPIEISAHAATRPPVKLGLAQGEAVPFGELLRAAIVGSKNDAATAVAEAVAGDESAFVARMNAAAAALGMVNTRYANATGLPADGQRTTARDIAILANALLERFPGHSELFARRAITAKGRGVTTTNPLFGRVAGAAGLKTGFTCAAGYSIAGLVERDGRRVLAVTLGHPDKAARLSAVRGLFDAASGIPDGAALAQGMPQESAPPDIRACSGRGAEIVATDIPLPVDADLYLAGVTAKPRPLPPQLVAPQPARIASAPAAPRLAPRPTPAPAPQPRKPQPPPGPAPLNGWAAFLGAFESEGEALGIARGVTARDLSGKAELRTLPRERDGRHLAILYGLDRQAALSVCAAARRERRFCLALSPARLLNPKARWRR